MSEEGDIGQVCLLFDHLTIHFLAKLKPNHHSWLLILHVYSAWYTVTHWFLWVSCLLSFLGQVLTSGELSAMGLWYHSIRLRSKTSGLGSRQEQTGSTPCTRGKVTAESSSLSVRNKILRSCVSSVSQRRMWELGWLNLLFPSYWFWASLNSVSMNLKHTIDSHKQRHMI